MNLTEIAQCVGKFTADNSPAILTAIAVTGTVTTAYLAGKASFKAAQILDDMETIAIQRKEDPATTKEKVEMTWKLFVPAAGTCVMTIACIIGANQIGNRRAAGMAAAYAISERALEQYKEKIVEKIGDRKEQVIRDEIAQDEVTTRPVSREVLVFGSGDVLCFDKYSQRYFTSDVESLKAAQNFVNHMVNSDFYASLTDFYDRIGLPATGFSNEVGWNADRLMELQFSTTISDDNRPCIVVDFTVQPIRGYYRMN